MFPGHRHIHPIPISRVLRSKVITDPGDQPPSSDQLPFSVRSRSASIRGDCMTKPPPTFSARHPGSKKGCIASSAGNPRGHMTRLVTRETHHRRPVTASELPGWLLQRRRPDRKQILYQYVSMSVKPDLPIGAGCTGRSFPIRRCIKSSNSEGIGVTFGGDSTGVGSRCCSNDSNSSWAAGVILSAAPGRLCPAFPRHLSYKWEGTISGWGTTPLGPPNRHDSPTPGTDQQYPQQQQARTLAQQPSPQT